MAWIAAALLSNWHFLLGRELKYWFLVRWFLRNRQRRNGFWAVDVSVGTLAASSVCMATWIAAWKSSSSATILKSALRSASLFTEQMKRVHNASSKGSAMEAKSHVAAAWRMRAASSWMDSPGRRCMVVQNLKRSRMTKRVGSNCTFMYATIWSIVRSLISLGGVSCAARFESNLHTVDDWLVRKLGHLGQHELS